MAPCPLRRCERPAARGSLAQWAAVRVRTRAPSGSTAIGTHCGRAVYETRRLVHRSGVNGDSLHASAQPVRPAAAAPLRAVLLDPVPRRRQRQHLQERADHLRRVPGGESDRARPERAGQPRRRGVHRAVRAALGDRGSARRQVREIAADPADQALRDRDHGRRPGRLLAAQPRAAVRRAGADGRALDAVRPGQVRDPAAAPAQRGTHRRQRPGRDGNVRRHPARHDRRRARRRDQPDGAALGGRARHRRRRRRLPREPPHSRTRRRSRRTSRINWNPFTETWKQPALRAGQPRRLAVDARHLVVLVLRRDVPRPVRRASRKRRPRRRRARRDVAARAVLGRHRRRIAAVRAAVRAQGRAGAGAVRVDRPDAVRRRPLVREPRAARDRRSPASTRSSRSRRTGASPPTWC